MSGPIVRRWEAKVPRGRIGAWLETFRSRALPGMKAMDGFHGISIQGALNGDPCEVTVLSTWEDETAIRRYAGEDTIRAVVPDFMEPFLVEYDPGATLHEELLLEVNR